MKRLYIILLSVLGITSCLGTHYFEPEVIGTSDTEDKISHKGETCWFEVEYQQVVTKFQPGMAFKRNHCICCSREYDRFGTDCRSQGQHRERLS